MHHCWDSVMAPHRHTLLGILLAACFTLQQVHGKGYLQQPAARNSMWRYGFNNPENQHDGFLNCGGYETQWHENGGACGVCGDPWHLPTHDHEVGGRYANGIVAAVYQKNKPIRIKINIAVNRLGYFQFKICDNNDPGKKVTQECFDRHGTLKFTDFSNKWMIGSAKGELVMNIILPEGLTCAQCVLQWYYHTGDRWGTSPDGTSCLGCGKQEEFYNCADIAITSDAPTSTTPTPTANPPPTQAPPGGCKGAGMWEGDPGMDEWCRMNCPANCPSSHCACD